MRRRDITYPPADKAKPIHAVIWCEFFGPMKEYATNPEQAVARAKEIHGSDVAPPCAAVTLTEGNALHFHWRSDNFEMEGEDA
ncbi:hypothetical protein [Paracoccus sp. MKU1]|uniref:hypothetical protein n=1 Tax=Paracoccus sp. MKU1 TaxID=1745182 RepID=UPI0007192B92|nr:hypothetical protein [Paracoccus sp. MKU1]KRW94312.1 hypothetical protein AQY21_20500 [Paracoccus sp. MKU1]